MSDSSSVTIPEELKKQFPKLIELIVGSESMNDEERQYWVNILPVMTPEQRENLEQILQNEKDQLAAIDAKYEKEMKKAGSGTPIVEMAKRRREKRSKRTEREEAENAKEAEKEAAILDAIAQLEA